VEFSKNDAKEVLVGKAISTQLDQAAGFLDAAVSHEQVTLANEIYHRLAMNIDQVTEVALFTPVHKCPTRNDFI